MIFAREAGVPLHRLHRYVRLKGGVFLAALVINKVSNLVSLVSNRVCSCTLVLNRVYSFSAETTFSSLSMRPSTKAHHNAFNIEEQTIDCKTDTK